MFKRHRLLAAAAAIAASGTVALTGRSAASASPARPAASGTEHVQLMSTSATSNTAPVIVYGVFTASGVDHMGNKADTVKFPGASFKINHSPGKGPQHFNPKTCLAQIAQHGPCTLSGGTGKHKGIGGHGRYHVTLLFLGKKVHGTCSQKAAPVAFRQIIQASGPLSL
ncbi:MAG: hypothetical protein ACRDPO_03130 [Streptosporangiaceae bacterium]